MSKNLKSLLFWIGSLLAMILYISIRMSINESTSVLEELAIMVLSAWLGFMTAFTYCRELLQAFKRWWRE